MKLDARQRFFLILFLASLFTFVFFYHASNKDEKCLKVFPVFSFPLKNILDDEANLNVSASHQIFLIETHMDKERILSKPRQACTVESAARTNPDMDVYFLFGTNSDGVNMKYSDMVEGLLSYPNIHLRYINPKEFSKGTKLENFFQRGAMDKSSFPIEHAADVMRVLILNKYGGQYLDLDLFSLVPLSTINRQNFACAESENLVANGIMNLDTDEFGGKAISNKYLEFIEKDYAPLTWGGNGPAMFTKSIKAFCDGTKLQGGAVTKCGNFSTLPTTKCYPIFYGEWKKVFQDENKDYVLKKLNETGAYFLHVWNKMQDFDKTVFKLKYDSKSAYMHLAKTHCPKVYETTVNFF